MAHDMERRMPRRCCQNSRRQEDPCKTLNLVANPNQQAFPDISFHAYQHPLIASGPYVVGRWIGGGTHTGVAFHDLAVGALEKANTGKKMYFSGTTIFTLKDGLIVDETGEEGALTALQQLGLVQQPNPGKEVKYLHE